MVYWSDNFSFRSGVRSAICATSQLSGRGGPLMWILPLYLHVNNKKSDDDEDDDDDDDDEKVFFHKEIFLITVLHV